MKNQIKTFLLMGVLSSLLIGLGYVIGPSYVWIFTFVAVAMNLGGYFFSDKIILRLYKARELAAGEQSQIQALVSELAVKAEIPKPRVFWIDTPTPNAFATGRNPQHGIVAVTAGLVASLTTRELKGVLAHEIAHIKNRDILVATLAASVAAAISHIGSWLQWTTIFGGGRSDSDQEGPHPLFMALIAPIAATMVQLAISRSREYMADSLGARLTGDPEALASALLKLEQQSQVSESTLTSEPATASLFIVNPFAGTENVLKLFSTHPPTKDRVQKLRSMQLVPM